MLPLAGGHSKAQLPHVNSHGKLFLGIKQGQFSHQGQGNVLCIYFVANQVGTYTVPICKVISEAGKRCKWIVNTATVRPFSFCIPSMLSCIRRRNERVSQVCSCNHTCLSKKTHTHVFIKHNKPRKQQAASLLRPAPPLSCTPKQLSPCMVPFGTVPLYFLARHIQPWHFPAIGCATRGPPLRPQQYDVFQARCWLLSHWIVKAGDDLVMQMMIFYHLLQQRCTKPQWHAYDARYLRGNLCSQDLFWAALQRRSLHRIIES